MRAILLFPKEKQLLFQINLRVTWPSQCCLPSTRHSCGGLGGRHRLAWKDTGSRPSSPRRCRSVCFLRDLFLFLYVVRTASGISLFSFLVNIITEDLNSFKFYLFIAAKYVTKRNIFKRAVPCGTEDSHIAIQPSPPSVSVTEFW